MMAEKIQLTLLSKFLAKLCIGLINEYQTCEQHPLDLGFGFSF